MRQISVEVANVHRIHHGNPNRQPPVQDRQMLYFITTHIDSVELTVEARGLSNCIPLLCRDEEAFKPPSLGPRLISLRLEVQL